MTTVDTKVPPVQRDTYGSKCYHLEYTYHNLLSSYQTMETFLVACASDTVRSNSKTKDGTDVSRLLPWEQMYTASCLWPYTTSNVQLHRVCNLCYVTPVSSLQTMLVAYISEQEM